MTRETMKPPSRLALFLLGSPRIEVDGRALGTDRRKAVALLAYLAVEGGSHERDALAALFWPDYQAPSALAYLRRTVWEINHMLGPGFVAADRRQVRLAAPAWVWLDVHALALALQGEDEDDIAQAVDLYRGDFMAGFSLVDAADFEDWQRFQAQKWRSELGAALDRLSARLAESGRFEPALTCARRWAALDPLYEAAQRRLIQLYAQSGNRAAALHHYETLVAALAEELAAAPEAETTALAAQIRAGGWRPAPPAAGAVETPVALPAPPAATPPLHLPTPATPFVGRKRELAEIGALLSDANCRLLTLVGPGGMGKTRLAIAAAAAAGPAFADGAWFASLAELDSAHQVAPALADSLGIALRSGGVDALQQVLEFLYRRRLLLVLDNLEHLLQNGLTGMINDLLINAPAVKILATSRARLNLQSEQIYLLGGMSTPSTDEMRAWRTPAEAANYSALALFVQRARRVQPDFELALADLDTVAQICRRLGGMPLGIELAAGWMAALSPADILAEIERSLDFLETDRGDVPARQRSLRAVLDASLAHLLPDEQAVFSRCGLFAGSFSRQAAERIAGAAPKLLLGLVNKSVLRRDGADRFAMHPVVAHYAAENLERDPALRTEVEQRFITHYLGCLARHGQDLAGPKQEQALAALEIDIAHIRQAWRLAVAAGRWEEASAALGPLFSAHHARLAFDASFSDLMQQALDLLAGQGRSRAADLLSAQTMAMLASHLSMRNWAFLSQSDLPAAALALVRQQHLQEEMGVALSWLGQAIAVQGNLVQGLEVIGDSEALLRRRGQRAALALTLLLKSGLLHGLNQRAAAKAAVEESIAICRQIGDNLQLAHSLSGMGDILASEQDFDAASQLYHESQTIFTSLGDLGDVANVVFRLADSQMHSGRYEAAIVAFEACRQLFVRLGDRFYCISVLSWESLCAARAGDMARAWELRRMCLQEAEETGEELNIGWSIWEMGELHRLEGDWEAARRYYEDSAALLRRSNFMRADIFIERGWGDLNLAQGQPQQAALHFQRSLDLAAAESYPWGIARAHIGLGQTALALDEASAAWEHFRLSLRQAREWGMDQGLMCMAVAGLAATHLAQGEASKALSLATFALGQPATVAETRRDLGPVIDAASASLPAAEIAAAEQRGRALALPAVVAAYSDD